MVVDWDVSFESDRFRAAAEDARRVGDGVQAAISAVGQASSLSGALGMLVGPLVAPVFAVVEVAAHGCLRAGGEAAADIARRLEESARVMEQCEQEVADEFERIGGQL